MASVTMCAANTLQLEGLEAGCFMFSEPNRIANIYISGKRGNHVIQHIGS